MLRALMADRSFFNCYESLQVSRGAVADKPQVFDAGSASRVTDLDFTPNRLTFTVANGSTDARLVLNQNWARGWTTTLGPINAPPATELAALTVPPGQTGRFEFSFVPPGFYTGIAFFVVALIATVLLWKRGGDARLFISAPPPR